MKARTAKSPMREAATERQRSSRRTPSPAASDSGTLFLQRCACGGSCPRCQAENELSVQPKLRISHPGDRYEREADRMADQVLHMPETLAEPSHAPTLQARATPETTLAVAPEITRRIAALHGGGQALPGHERRFFEERMGADFSGVRVHTGPSAAKLTEAVQARAFTMGRNVVFGRDAYRPSTTAGRQLLAHELTHVVQQEAKSLPPTVQRRDEPGAVVATPGATQAPAANAPDPGRPSPDERTRREVYVVDFGVNRDVVNWRETIMRIGEIEAESVDQMVRDVRARIGNPADTCISKLTLDGHGSPGNMSVGDGTGWVEGKNISTGHFRPSLATLTPYFCDDARVVLLGCNVGRGAIGARFLQTLADYWQVDVAAANSFVNGFGIQGVWVWGIPGQVLPGDTALIVDQIRRIVDETTYGDDEEMILDILEGSDARGLLAAIRAELVRLGYWSNLVDDLRDEDESRFNQLYPNEP